MNGTTSKPDPIGNNNNNVNTDIVTKILESNNVNDIIRSKSTIQKTYELSAKEMGIDNKYSFELFLFRILKWNFNWIVEQSL
jgi:hypothetical protein